MGYNWTWLDNIIDERERKRRLIQKRGVAKLKPHSATKLSRGEEERSHRIAMRNERTWDKE